MKKNLFQYQVAEVVTTYRMTGPADRPEIKRSGDAEKIIRAHAGELTDRERFSLIYLDRANKVIAVECISIGGTAATVVDAKIVFRSALAQGASNLILSHNHPSGNLKPSQADIDITRKLKEAGKVLDIVVLDHIILSEHGYTSLADEGQM